MSRKPKRKRKRSQKSGQPMPPQPKNQLANERPKRVGQFWTILGIVIGLIGLIALIKLSPRLSVSTEPPLEPNNLIPSFSVRNDGYLKLKDVEAACFLWKATVAGPITYDSNLSERMFGVGPEKLLSPTQTLTTRPGMNFAIPANQVDQIDLGIIVYFRPWPFTFLRSRRVFRFVGHPVGNALTWYKQPSGDLETALDKFLRNWKH